MVIFTFYPKKVIRLIMFNRNKITKHMTECIHSILRSLCLNSWIFSYPLDKVSIRSHECLDDNGVPCNSISIDAALKCRNIDFATLLDDDRDEGEKFHILKLLEEDWLLNIIERIIFLTLTLLLALVLSLINFRIF